MELEDVQTAALRSTIDDEYARAGASDVHSPCACERQCDSAALPPRSLPPSGLPLKRLLLAARCAGEEDPKIIVTTSRDPSSRLTAFAKELKLVFPNAQRINRGGQARARRRRRRLPSLLPPFHLVAAPNCSVSLQGRLLSSVGDTRRRLPVSLSPPGRLCLDR